MSWAADEWKDGLPQKALAKIRETEAHLERLKKERDQKQFQVESLEQALEVQKRKGGNEKSEIATLQRENKSLVEACKELEKKTEKLTSDLSLKDNQVTGLEKKVAELGSSVPGKIAEPAQNQHEQMPDGHSETIRSLQQELAELRKQLEEKCDTASVGARTGSGDEGGSSKPLGHMSEGDGLRKTQQELQTLRSLVSELEGKNKKLIKDGECTRHNTEAARLHLEVKMKETEKELQRELAQAMEAARHAERLLQESKVKWQQELNAAHAEESKLKGLMEKLEAENARLVREQEDFTKRLAAVDDVIKTHAAKVVEADKRKAAVETEKQNLALELEHKAREIQAQNAELLKLKNDIGQKEQAIDALKGQLMDKTVESETCKTEADAALQKLLQAQNHLMELQKLQQKTDNHVKEMSLSLNQLQKEKETLEGSNTELVKQLTNVQEEVQLVSASFKDSQTRLGEVTGHFTESQNKWNDLEKTLRHELSHNVSSIAELSERKVTLENQLSAKDEEIVELGHRCEASEKKVSSRDEELSQKTQGISELEKQLQNLQEQLEVLQKEHHQQETLAKEKATQLEMVLIEKREELEMFVIQSSQDRTVLETEAKKLLEEKQTLQQEIHSCRVECESGRVLIASLNEEMKTLKEVLESRDSSVAEMESVIQNQDKELRERKEENVALSSGVSQRDGEIQFMKEKLVSAEKELEVSQKELQAVGERCEALEAGKASLSSQIEECQRQDECHQQVRELLEKQVADLQSQFGWSQSECSTLSQQVKGEQEKVTLLEKNVDSLRNKCCELESHASVCAAELASKSAACEQLEGQCVQLSQFLDSHKAEISSLSSQICSLETQLSECSKLHRQTVAELREQLQEADKYSDMHKCLLEQKDNRVTELENEITRLKNGMSDLESVRLSQEVEIDEKSVLVHSLEKTCASLGDELEVLKLKVTEKEHQLCLQLENLRQIENKIGQLEEEKQALEVSTTEQLDKLQKELLQQTQDLSQRDLRITQLEDQRQDLSNRLVGAQKEAEELDTEHAQDIGALKSKLDMLEMDVEDSDGHVHDLNGKVSDLTSLLEKLTQERDDFKETVQPLSEEIGELKANLESEQACLAAVKQERDDFKETIQLLSEEIGELKANLEFEQARLVEVKQERDNLKETIQTLSEEIGELKENLESEQACLAAVKQERDRLTEENSNLTTELEQMNSLIHSLEERQTSLSDELKASHLKMKEKEDILCSHLDVLSQKENVIRQLEEEKKALEITAGELDILQKEVLQQTQDLGQKASRITELEDHVQDLSSRLSEAQKEVLDLEAKYTHETGTLKSQLDMLQMGVEDSDGHVRELNGQVSDLTSLLEKATQERDGLRESLQPLCEEVGELKMSLESEQACLVEVKQQRDRVTEESSRLKSTVIELQTELERKHSLYEEQELCLIKIRKDNEEFVKRLHDCEAERDLLICSTNELEQVLVVEKELVLAKSQEIVMLNENRSLLSQKLQTVTEQLSEQILEVSSRTQCLQAVECRLKELESSCVMHEERKLEEVEELRLLVLQREESLAEVGKRREELENVVEDLKCQLSRAEQLNSDGVLQHEQNAAILQSKLGMLQMDIEDKNCVVQKLSNKICDLERLIEKMVQEKEEICEAETGLRSSVLELKSAVETETQKTAQLKLNEDSLNDRVKDLDSSLADARLELVEKEKHLQALQEEYDSLRARSDKQEKQLSDERDQLIALQEECDSLRARSDTQEKQLSDERDQLIALQEEYDSLRARSDKQEKQFSDERDQLIAAKEDLQLCLASEKLTVQSRTSDFEAVTHRCGELSEQLEHVKGERSKLQTELDCHLQSQLVMNCRLEDQDAELTSLKEASRKDLDKLEHVKGERSKLQTELDCHPQSQLVMNCRLEDQEAELTRLKEASREDLEQLQQTLLEKQMELDERTSRIDDLDKKIVDLTSQLCDVQREQAEADICHRQAVARLKSQLEMLQMDYESEDCEVKELRTKICKLEREIECVVNEKVKIAGVVETLESKLLQLKSVLDMEREKATQAKRDDDTLKDRIKFLEAALSAVKFEKQGKESCLQTVQLECENAKEMIIKQERLIKECQIHQENADIMIKNGHEALDEQKLLVEAKTLELNVAHERYAAVLEELEMVRSEVMDKQNEVDARAQDIVQLENKINRLEQEKASVRVELIRDVEELHQRSFDATLSGTTREHPREVIEGSNDLNAEMSRVEGIQLQLSNLQEKCTEAGGESSSDGLQQEKCTEAVGESSSDGLQQALLAMPVSTMDELQNEIEQKNLMINELSHKNTDLETALSAVNDENGRLQTTKALLESENSLLQESCGTLKEDTMNLMSETQRLLTAIADLENLLSEKTASLESGQQGLIKLEQRLEEAQVNCDSLKLSLSKKTDQISHLETIVKDLESQLEVINNEQSCLANCPPQDGETITLQLSSMKEDLEARHTELEQLKTQFDDVNRALVKSNSKLAELQVEKATLSEQLEDVEKLTKSYLQERDNTINILREELDSAAQENDALKTDKGEWQAREDRYKQDISDLDVKLADLNMEVVSTRESFESVSNQRFEAQGKLYNVLQEKKDLEDRLKEMELELDEAKGLARNVQNLEVTLENSKQEMVAKDEETKCLKAQLNEMTLENLKQEIVARDEEIKCLKAQLNDMTLENSKQVMVAKDEETKCLKAQLNEMGRSRLGEFDSLQKQKEDLETCLTEANERNRDLEEQLNEVTCVMNEMKDQLAQLQELMQTLNNSVDSKRKEILQRVNEISEKNDEIFNLKALVEEKEKTNNNMSDQITNIQKETSCTLGTLQDAIESLNFELQAAEEEKNALAGENEMLKKESLELHEKIKGPVNAHLQETCRSQEPSSQVSRQDFHTLQDALESLNFELKAVEEEKDALVSENERLKEESTQLREKIQTLTQVSETASYGEVSTESSSAEKLVPDLTEYVHSSERENNDMKKQFENSLKLASDLSLQVQSLNEQLQVKITLSENMVAQVESLTADISLSVKQLSEKEAELCRSKEAEDCLNVKVSEMCNQITSLQLDLDCKNDLLQKLKDENETIMFKCQELESVIVQLQDEIKQEAEASETLKESWQTKEMAAPDLSKYEQVIRDYNFTVVERDQLKEKVQTLVDVEREKQKLEEELKLELHKQSVAEKDMLELQEELDRRRDLDEMLNAAEFENHSLRETVEKVELANQLLSDKVNELGKEIRDLMQGKDLVEMQVVRLQFDNYGLDDKIKEMTKMADDWANEKISLQDKVVKLESCNCQLEDRLKELDLKVGDLTIEKVSLQDEVKKLKSSNCELEDKLKELNQVIEDSALEKVSLQDEVKKLKSSNCELEDKLKELDQKIEDSALGKVSLQDEVEKLKSSNCELEDKLKEFDQIIEDSALEKVSLQDEVKKLKSSSGELEDKLKELNQIMENSTLEKVSIHDEVEKLKSSNCELEDKLKEFDQIIEDSALEKVSLQDEVKKLKSSSGEFEGKLKELDQIIEDSALEKVSLQDEVKKLKSSNCELEGKLKELDQIIEDSALGKVSLQDEVKKLKSSNCELEDKLKELNQVIEDSALEKVSLQDEVKKLTSSSCQVEDTMKELDQMIENAALEKISLYDQIKTLESNNCNLEGKLKELDQKVDDLTTEKGSLQNEIKKLESGNCQLEGKLQELNQQIEDLTSEKGALRDKLQTVQSSSQQLEEQLKEMEVAASEYVKLKDKFEVREQHLAEKLKELSQVVAERALLECQLKDLQNEHSRAPDAGGSNKSEQISEQHKELLRKWEQRCSELNNQLAMDRKKVQRLTEQVEKLKAAKDVESVEDSKALKEELGEMKQERDVYQEKYMKMSEAAERHFNKSKDLQRVNEKLNSRNKLLNALLKGEKPRVIVPVQVTASSLRFGAQNLHREPDTGGGTEASTSSQETSAGPAAGQASEHGLPSCESQQMEQLSGSVSHNMAASSHADTGKARSILEDNSEVSSHVKEKRISDAHSVKTDSLLEEKNKVTSHVGEKLISDADTVKAGSSLEENHQACSSIREKLIFNASSEQAHSILEESQLNLGIKTDSIQAETTKAHNVSKVNNNVSCDTKEKPVPAEDSQNLAEASDHADSGTGACSTRSSTRLKLRSPKGQGVQKPRISTPKSAIPSQLVQSTQKQKVEFISDVTSLSKMHTQTLKDSELSSLKSLKIPESPSLKFKKHAFTGGSVLTTVSTPSKIPHPSTSTASVLSHHMPSKLSHTSTSTSTVSSNQMPSKLSHTSTSASTISSHNTPPKTSHPSTSTTVSRHGNELDQVSNVRQSSDVADQLKPILSPRVSRRMSLQKRRSVDQSGETTGGKRSKLSLKETVPESKSQASRLPQPASTRTGQTSGLPRPMRTRSSRQEALPSQNALATITNSPRKTPSQESKPRRASRATARTARSPRAQAADEGASECKIN